MFYVQVQKSEHAQYALLFYAHAIGWNGLSLPAEGCSVHTPIVITNFKVRVLNRTLSHIWWRLYLPTFLMNVGLLTLMYIDSLMVLSRPLPSLPPYNGKVIRGWCCVLTGFCVHKWVRVPSGAPYIFHQRSWDVSYVLLITHELPTLIPVDDPTLFCLKDPVFRLDQHLLNGSITLEVGLDAILPTYLLDTLS